MSGIVNVQITDDNTDYIKSLMKDQLMLGLKAVGQKAEGFAKEECPVDTGTLRNSISNKVDKANLAVHIGTNIEYAPQIELVEMKHKVGKAHFLRDAASDHGDDYKKILYAALSK